MATLTPVLPRVNPGSGQATHTHTGLLRPSRSQKARVYDVEPAGLGAVLPGAKVPGTNVPVLIDLWLTIHTGGKAQRYAVALNGWTTADGLITAWYKCGADGRYEGTTYNLSYDGRVGSCDCPGCCFEAVSRADHRHGERSGSLGCAKLDTFAALVEVGAVPDPRANGEADMGDASHDD